MDSFQTGDLLLFSSSSWYGRLIEYFTSSPYSHVAVVYRRADEVFALESSLEPKNGVQLISLADLLRQYGHGRAFVRRLRGERSPSFHDKFRKIVERLAGVPYDVNVIDWIAADLGLAVKRRTDAFFCSALAAFVYVQLKVVADCDWTIVRPADFADSATSRLTMEDGHAFGSIEEAFKVP